MFNIFIFFTYSTISLSRAPPLSRKRRAAAGKEAVTSELDGIYQKKGTQKNPGPNAPNNQNPAMSQYPGASKPQNSEPPKAQNPYPTMPQYPDSSRPQYPDSTRSQYPNSPSKRNPSSSSQLNPGSLSQQYPIQQYPSSPSQRNPSFTNQLSTRSSSQRNPGSPSQQYPIQQYPSSPSQQYPNQQYPISPNQQYPISPNQQYPISPNQQYPRSPNLQYPISPSQQYPSSPSQQNLNPVLRSQPPSWRTGRPPPESRGRERVLIPKGASERFVAEKAKEEVLIKSSELKGIVKPHPVYGRPPRQRPRQEVNNDEYDLGSGYEKSGAAGNKPWQGPGFSQENSNRKVMASPFANLVATQPKPETDAAKEQANKGPGNPEPAKPQAFVQPVKAFAAFADLDLNNPDMPWNKKG